MDANRWLITGVSTGLGRALAEEALGRGWSVAGTVRRVEDAEAFAALAPGRARAYLLDVAEPRAVEAVVTQAAADLGGLDVVVNNAGYGLMGAFEECTDEQIRRQFEVNVFGAMRLAQLVLPDMRHAGWGRIVNVSSVGGKISLPVAGWYSASKHALEALADALRLEVGPLGVAVVSLLPGPVRTEFLRNMDIVPLPPAMPQRYAALLERLHRHQANRLFEIPPEAVARVIVRAVEARRPRPRYLLTLPARVGIRLRPWFTDRGWDRFLTLFYGLHTPADGGRAER